MTQGTYQPSFMMSGTEKIWIGTAFRGPYISPEQRAINAARPSYAETEADRIIAACQDNGEVSFARLRSLIIEVLEDYA